jgi:hypothetical protein
MEELLRGHEMMINRLQERMAHESRRLNNKALRVKTLTDIINSLPEGTIAAPFEEVEGTHSEFERLFARSDMDSIPCGLELLDNLPPQQVKTIVERVLETVTKNRSRKIEQDAIFREFTLRRLGILDQDAQSIREALAKGEEGKKSFYENQTQRNLEIFRARTIYELFRVRNRELEIAFAEFRLQRFKKVSQDKVDPDLMERVMDRLMRVINDVGIIEGGKERVMAELDQIYQTYPRNLTFNISTEIIKIITLRVDLYFRKYIEDQD